MKTLKARFLFIAACAFLVGAFSLLLSPEARAAKELDSWASVGGSLNPKDIEADRFTFIDPITIRDKNGTIYKTTASGDELYTDGTSPHMRETGWYWYWPGDGSGPTLNQSAANPQCTGALALHVNDTNASGSVGDRAISSVSLYAVSSVRSGDQCIVPNGSPTDYDGAQGDTTGKGDDPNDKNEYELTQLNKASTFRMALAMLSWQNANYIAVYDGGNPLRKLTATELDLVKNRTGNSYDGNTVWTTEECEQASGLPNAFVLIGSDKRVGRVYYDDDSEYKNGWNGEQSDCIWGRNLTSNQTDVIGALDGDNGVYIAHSERATNAGEAPPDGDGGEVDPGADGSDDPDCNTRGDSALNWAICPFVNGIGSFMDWLFDGFIMPFLQVSPVSTDPSGNMFKVWSGFRVIANILLVAIFIVMIFGQAIGGGMVDAYTVKKVVPRLVIGAIGINLSIYLVAIVVDVVNVIGAGMTKLLTAPFAAAGGGAGYEPGHLAGAIPAGLMLLVAAGAGVYMFKRFRDKGRSNLPSGRAGLNRVKSSFTGGILGSVLPFFLLYVGLPMLIAGLGIFLTLLIRMGIILACVALAPLAVALWILPSTEQYFKKWWGLFTKALLVYPIIMLLFAVGDIMAYAFGGNLMDADAKVGLSGVMAISAQLVPFFIMPFAFKMAGGAVASLYGAMTQRGKQAGEFIKGRENDPNSLRNRTRENVADKTTQLRERAVNYSKRDGSGRLSRALGRSLNYGNLQARRSYFNKNRSDIQQAQIATGDDSNIRDLFIARAGNGQWFRRMDMERDDKGKLVAKAGAKAVYKNDAVGRMAHNKSMSLYGGNKSAVQDAMYYEWKKTGFDPGSMASIKAQYGDIAAEHGFDNFEMGEMVKAVGFRHQNQTLSSKYNGYTRDDETGHTGFYTDVVGMAQEGALNIGTYPWTNQDVTTFDDMDQGYRDVSDILKAAPTAAFGADGTLQTQYLRDMAQREAQVAAAGGNTWSQDQLHARELQLTKAYGGKTEAQLATTQDRIKRMATTLDPDARAVAPGAPPAPGAAPAPGGAPPTPGLGGVSGAPVDVQEAARRLRDTVNTYTP